MPTPRIVILDGYTTNPGDLSWEALAALGDLIVHDRTPDDQVIERSRGAACLLINKVRLDAATIDALPELRYIGVLATGYNIVDVAAAKRRGVVVTNIPAYGADSVAQHAAALMLELARRVGTHDRAVHAGQWSRNADWCFAVTPIVGLTGKTLGVIGMGRIGLAFAKIAQAMGMRILAHSRGELPAERREGVAMTYVDLDTLFAEADVVSLHCPWTPQTERMVNAARLGSMKRSAFLINTGRGQLIDNAALLDALREGRIAAAALDVLDVEPPPADHPLLAAPNCLITPHIAWYAREARQRLLAIAATNLEAFLAGQPRNVVSN